MGKADVSMGQAGVVRGLCKAAIGLIAAGTVACGVGLLNVVVRPGTIEQVGTLALLGVAGLIVLPPFTLAMAAFEWRWKRSGTRVGAVGAAPVGRHPERVVLREPKAVPPAAGQGLGVARAVSTASVPRRPVCVVRRGSGAAVMGEVASELAGEVRPGVRGAVGAASGRVTTHGGPRREVRRRRSAQDVHGPGGRESLSDSMMGFVVTPG